MPGHLERVDLRTIEWKSAINLGAIPDMCGLLLRTFGAEDQGCLGSPLHEWQEDTHVPGRYRGRDRPSARREQG